MHIKKTHSVFTTSNRQSIIKNFAGTALTIDHLCRNRSCVNPRHLEPVTIKVNTLRGTSPSARNAAKIACNMMIAMAIEAMAEGVVLTESVGLDRADFFELILGTLFSGRAYESYSAQITDRSFEPGFKAKLALKDMRLAVEAGNQIGRTLPMLEAVREGLANAVSSGLGEKDWSIMADMTVRNIATATDSGER